jgi:hypothetical protein
MTQSSDFFLDVTEPLLADSAVSRGTMMGFPCLRVDGAFFASCDRHSGDLIVKLPADRVGLMVAAGSGSPFRPNGRTFREWVLIADRNEEHWRCLIREALQFART